MKRLLRLLKSLLKGQSTEEIVKEDIENLERFEPSVYKQELYKAYKSIADSGSGRIRFLGQAAMLLNEKLICYSNYFSRSNLNETEAGKIQAIFDRFKVLCELVLTEFSEYARIEYIQYQERRERKSTDYNRIEKNFDTLSAQVQSIFNHKVITSKPKEALIEICEKFDHNTRCSLIHFVPPMAEFCRINEQAPKIEIGVTGNVLV